MCACKGSELLGRPREGVHRMRIPLLDWAVFDTLLTALLAVVLAYAVPVCSSVSLACNSLLWFALLVLLSLIVHRVFCVRTRLTEQLEL
jgi:hypothetical protein